MKAQSVIPEKIIVSVLSGVASGIVLFIVLFPVTGGIISLLSKEAATEFWNNDNAMGTRGLVMVSLYLGVCAFGGGFICSLISNKKWLAVVAGVIMAAIYLLLLGAGYEELNRMERMLFWVSGPTIVLFAFLGGLIKTNNQESPR